jgi:ABC-type Na+ transport system ATPase subunit NatA
MPYGRDWVEVYGLDVTRESLPPAWYPTCGDACLYARLIGRDNLELFAELNSLPRKEASHRIADLTGVLRQGEPLDRQVRTLSTGNAAHSHVRIDELKLRALIAQFF